MKSIVKSALLAAIWLVTNILHAQLNNYDLSAIESQNPIQASQLPAVGTFYSAANPQLPPAPANLFGMPVWVLDSNAGIYLLDDLDSSSGGNFHPMDDPGPPGFNDDTNSGGGYEFTNNVSFSFPTNGLWLWITNVANNTIYANLNGATDYVYEVFPTTSLTTQAPATNWNIETEVFAETNTTTTPFSVSVNGRNPFFLWARDWTGITNNGNLTPEWWLYWWYGINGLSLSDSDLDTQGNTLYNDYLNGFDPNVIGFSLSFTNQFFNISNATVQLDISDGTPYYAAVLVDDTNQPDANWTPYLSSNIIINLGTIEGWHQIYVGLRGLPSTAYQTWVPTRLKLQLTPPTLVVTNLAAGPVTQPVIQLQGYSTESLASLSYDLSNATGLATNQKALILDQYYDTNALEYTTNYFQCFDLPLTQGQNIVTLHATDLAGNVTATNFTFTLGYPTNPPAIQLNWPQNGTQISGTNFTWRGYVNEPTAQVTAQVANTNGVTNSATAQVGRGGDFWVYGLPLSTGTNYLSLTATDVAGNTSTTNIVVTQSALTLTITSAGFGQAVEGTISDWTNYTVWVNGVIATNNNNGTWIAYPNLTLDTPAVQVRAIPNSDNGGYGGGQ